MRNIVYLLKRFIEESRNNNNVADCSWHTQRQAIYIRYNNICSNSSKLQKPSITESQGTA